MRYKNEEAPAALFDSDNRFGIPNLLPSRVADFIDVPVLQWGRTNSRTFKESCTVHFYTDDYRFSNLWAYPEQLLKTGCVTAIEPNYSLGDHTPEAVVIWRTYQKRWLSRYWQEKGIRIFVDLSVPTEFSDYNMLGVPHNYDAFSYRGYNGHTVEDLEHAYRFACSWAGYKTRKFLVYGGGYDFRKFCIENNMVWIPEQSKVRDSKRSHREYQLSKSVNLDKLGVVSRGR